MFLFPSVTTLLDATTEPHARKRLETWQRREMERLGEAGFDKMMKEKLQTGSQLHEIIRGYLTGVSDAKYDFCRPKSYVMIGRSLNFQMSNKICVPILGLMG